MLFHTIRLCVSSDILSLAMRVSADLSSMSSVYISSLDMAETRVEGLVLTEATLIVKSQNNKL